jgi:tetraacyldisaccharide 4'-kinase
MACMLTPFGWLYGKIINQRNSLYDKGSLKSTSLGVPTISVGNITVGGTGKTPLVALVAETLAEKGEKVCIISRGYKRENENKRILVSDSQKILTDVKKAGDEPFELAGKLIGKAFVIADANRVEAGIWAKNEFGITAFVLDDAFQHRKVKRDLDIITIDATNPFGNGKTLPAGILREPLENLKRADLFVITRANLSTEIESIKEQIKLFNQSATIIVSRNISSKISEINDFTEFEASSQNVTSKRCLAFCALGNPDNFFDQLIDESFDIVTTKRFSDHHFYSQKDIGVLEKKARKSKAEALLTTSKDAVKIKDLKFELPCYIVESAMVFDDKKKLHKMIYAIL